MYNSSETVNLTQDDSRQSWESHVAMWLYRYSPWITMTIAALGNGAAFITLIKMRPFSSLSLIVSYLAVMDTLCVACSFIHTMLNMRQVSLGVFGCRMLTFITNYTLYLANWALVLMTVERFVAVTYPLKISRCFTFKRSIIYLLSMALFFFLPTCPSFWTYTELYNGNQNICDGDDVYEELLVVLTWVDLLLISLLPCTLLIFLNSAIARSLYKAAKRRRGISNKECWAGRPNRTTEMRPKFPHAHLSLMLVSVSVAFIVLQLPITIFYITDKYRIPSEDPLEKWQHFLVAMIIHTLNELNHSFNFFFYFLSGKKFRQRFLEVFYCRKLFDRARTHKGNNTEGSFSHNTNSCETKMLQLNDGD